MGHTFLKDFKYKTLIVKVKEKGNHLLSNRKKSMLNYQRNGLVNLQNAFKVLSFQNEI